MAITSYGRGKRRADINDQRKAVIYCDNGYSSQIWEMIRHPDDPHGTFRLRNVSNNDCLEPANNNNDARIGVYNCRASKKASYGVGTMIVWSIIARALHGFRLEKGLGYG